MKPQNKYILICVVLCAILSGLYAYRLHNVKAEAAQPQTFFVGFGVGDSNIVSVQIDDKILLSANVTQPHIDIPSDTPDKFRYYSQLAFTLYPTTEQIANDAFVYILDYKTKKGVQISLRDLSYDNYGMTYVSFGNVTKNKISSSVNFENKSMMWDNSGSSQEHFPVRVFSVSP